MVIKGHDITPDPGFDAELDEVLRARLQPLLGVRAPELGTRRTKSMTTIVKVAIAAAAATLALGAGAAFASGETATLTPHGLALGVSQTMAHHGRPAVSHGPSGAVEANSATNRDAHGDAVSTAAHTCAKSPGDAHGDCVSAAAHTRP